MIKMLTKQKQLLREIESTHNFHILFYFFSEIFFQPLTNKYIFRSHSHNKKRKKTFRVLLPRRNVNINDFFPSPPIMIMQNMMMKNPSISPHPKLLPKKHNNFHPTPSRNSRWIKRKAGWNWIIFKKRERINNKIEDFSFEMHYTLFLALNETKY